MDDLTAFITARLDEDEAQQWPDYSTLPPSGWPERRQREVAAKRKRLAAYLKAQATADKYGDDRYMVGLADGLADTIRDDAAVWSDHPGYRQEWAT